MGGGGGFYNLAGDEVPEVLDLAQVPDLGAGDVRFGTCGYLVEFDQRKLDLIKVGGRYVT